MEAYLSRLYRYAFSLAREEELAKELVQLCALKSLAAKTVPQNESAYRAWLFVILRNAFRDHLRRGRLTNALFDPESEHEDVPAMEYWRGDERLINILNVKQAMARLRPKDQEIIGLVDTAGLTYAEASKVLGGAHGNGDEPDQPRPGPAAGLGGDLQRRTAGATARAARETVGLATLRHGNVRVWTGNQSLNVPMRLSTRSSTATPMARCWRRRRATRAWPRNCPTSPG